MKETKRILALCDPEEEYAQLMTEFIRKYRELPWEIRTYTNPRELLKEQKDLFVMLVVAESAYCEEMELLGPLKLVVLNESGMVRWNHVTYVDKYQPAEEVLRCILQLYMEAEDDCLPRFQRNYHTVLFGFFTPVHRSLQTSFALTMSQLLAREHATLYLNFESYAGIGELLPNMQTPDLTDLMLFLNADKEKLRLKMQTICKKLGGLDYIPPMKSGQNLLMITKEEWVRLLQRIEELGEYEYVVLDLSESLQGLFEILRLCRKIFTMTGEDKSGHGKLLQYEQLLSLYDYEDVIHKTERLQLPSIQKLPEHPEQLTKGELAVLVNRILEEELT